MRRRVLGPSTLLVAVVLVLCARALAIETTLVADAHVNAARPGANSGSISNVNVGGGYTGLMQFDLGLLPVGTTPVQVSRAVLRVYANRVDTPGLVSVAPVLSAWSEYGVTFATMPGVGSAAQVFTVSQAGAFAAVDVTALVQGWVGAPATNFGVALTAGTAVLQLDSKENDLTAHPATLEVELASQGPAGVAGPAGARGAAGPAGPAGLAGVPGPTGIQGPKGDPGAPGAAGAVGADGKPGLGYQGAYQSATNYAVGDVVLWQGSSWASLVAANHGNTPSLSPGAWGLVAAQGLQGLMGAAGAPGPTGSTGALGPVGPPGQKGDQGAQGLAGQAGAQGLTGAKGDMGLSGPMGPQGVPGPVGLAFQGAYQSARNYAIADGVLWQGASYVSLVAGNHGNTPDQSPGQWMLFAAAGAVGPRGPAGANFVGNYDSAVNYGVADAVGFGGSTYVSLMAGNHGNTPGAVPGAWAVLAAQGPAGPAGAAGVAGAPGAVGAAGIAGAIGPAGPPVSFKGGWLTGSSYALGDAVSHGGGSYIALVANGGRQPDISPIYWGSLAQAGGVGPVGPAGATGFQGPTGYPGPQGPAGVPGAAGPAGPVGPQGLAGPVGPAGATGAMGAAGAGGLVYRGTYNSVTNYGLNDGVVWQGSSYVSLQGPNAGNTPSFSPTFWALIAAAGTDGAPGAAGTNGAAGPMGPSGPSGNAATVQVGTVTTAAAGTQASVVNTGTSSGAVLNFTIPQGAQGVPGTGGGGGGTSGVAFATMYHLVSYSTLYYSVNNTNQSPAESATVLSWVPNGCTATKIVAYSQQAATITVTLRMGIPGVMADTALSCSVAQGRSCTGTGSVAVAAGQFVELGIKNADANAQPVWTAVLCN